MSKIIDMASLKEAVKNGENIKYVYFWGHSSKHDYVTQHCLSQWYPRGFEKDGVHYPTAEHYLMAHKALLFNDKDIYQKIVKAQHPGEVKKFGREVKDFNEAEWDKHKLDIAIVANTLKFTQHEDLKEYLMNTGDKVLVEASPLDKIWGVGLAKDDPQIIDPNNWQGHNLLGFALMRVRELIK